jgi:Tfp pilus assembly protein PilE
VKCQPCGQDNAATALFCTACRRPLVAPSKLPTRIEPLAQPAMAAAAPAMASGYGDAAPSSRNRFAPPNAGAASRAHGDPEAMSDEEAWAAVIGDSGTSYYLERFGRLAKREGGGWHWPGFLVTWYWMLYRKLWIPALIYFVAPYVAAAVLGAVAAVSPVVGGLAWIVVAAAWLIVPGLRANALYYAHCMKKIRDVRARGGSRDQMIARLEALGGTSGIIIIVVVFVGIAIVGILAAVALPAYQTYTAKAKVSQAVLVGAEVAQAVGRQYEQTGALPGSGEIDSLVLHSRNHSQYVSAVELDSASGTLTVRVAVDARVNGSIQFVPSSDNNRHLSWTCTTQDMQRYVPRSCRPDAAGR